MSGSTCELHWCPNEVAGTHLAVLCAALASAGIGIEIVQVYAQLFKLPRSRGSKVSDLFFKATLVTTDHVRHFASEVLGMVAIMYAFLHDRIKPLDILQSNIECFSLLFQIICILRRGDMSKDIHRVLTKLVVKHNEMFLALYGNHCCKIKFHHLYHLPADMLYLLQCLSCFPMERKNKDAIAVSVATDVNVEKTSVISFLHRTLAFWVSPSACEERRLLAPRNVCINGMSVTHSRTASLTCGDVSTGDMVALLDGSIGRVISFWQNCNSIISAGLQLHMQLPNTQMLYQLQSHDVAFVDVRSIVEPIFWYAKSNSIFVVVPDYGN